MKEYLLHIETATTNCSVAVSLEGELLYCKESNAPDFRHSDYLHLFIEAALKEADVAIQSLAGVGVSMGPGSYTGLRIGVSTAKGLAYSLGIPLISVDSLTSLFHLFKRQNIAANNDLILPMIDARRQEVYTMACTIDGKIKLPISSKVIDSSFFQLFSNDQKLHLIGDGCEKFKGKYNATNINYCPSVICSAIGMIDSSFEKFLKKDFEDVAYFVPKYIKEFHFN